MTPLPCFQATARVGDSLILSDSTAIACAENTCCERLKTKNGSVRGAANHGLRKQPQPDPLEACCALGGGVHLEPFHGRPADRCDPDDQALIGIDAEMVE